MLSEIISKLPYMTIGERIKQARAEAGLTQEQLAKYVGVSRAAVTQWESGDTKGLKPQNLFPCARALKVHAEWLGTGEGPKKLDESHKSKGFRHPSTAPRATQSLTPLDGPRHPIPVISYIQAGEPKEAVEAYAIGDGFETITVEGDVADNLGKHAFALMINGDSMLPEFRPGDIVIIDPDAPVRPGDIVVARLDRDHEATLKKYRDRGVDTEGWPIIELKPLNENYGPMTIDASNPGKIIGRVVEHRRRFR